MIARDLREARRFFSLPEGNPLEVFCRQPKKPPVRTADRSGRRWCLFASGLKLNYKKLPEEESGKRMAQKPDLLKNPKPPAGKKVGERQIGNLQ